MYNLTRYKVGDRVILARGELTELDRIVEVEILEKPAKVGKAPRMVKVRELVPSFHPGKGAILWLRADVWWVVARIK